MGIKQIKEHEQLLTAHEVADLLPDTSYQTVLRWARIGAIPYVKLPSGRKFFRRSDVDDLLTPRVATDALFPEDQALPGFGESGEC
ncbi:MAG: helix-turn-helix domain-containing protein [Actinomycetaceae bacterium]|nr:helix-turn-helix domain-containing protein [Actinomycetaceae bacterium]